MPTEVNKIEFFIELLKNTLNYDIDEDAIKLWHLDLELLGFQSSYACKIILASLNAEKPKSHLEKIGYYAGMIHGSLQGSMDYLLSSNPVTKSYASGIHRGRVQTYAYYSKIGENTVNLISTGFKSAKSKMDNTIKDIVDPIMEDIEPPVSPAPHAINPQVYT